ncbi:MAG: hypothetical protein ABTQ26_19310 [Azonexus sp.]
MSVESFQSLIKKRRPYYILAPDYARQSAGTRAMHLLCHLLNRSGEEAYIATRITAPGLQTPLLTPEIELRHKKADARPIAIYPEIVFGNPLNVRSIARLILNHPGLINGPQSFPESELLFFYNPEYATTLPERPPHLLQIPLIDTTLFNNDENPRDGNRSGILIYPGRFDEATERHPELFNHGTVITSEWPNTHPELACLLRSSKYLYCFSNSAIAQESVLCGCPVIFMESPLTAGFLDIYRRNPNIGRPPGMAIETTDKELLRAQRSITEFVNIHGAIENSFMNELANFITATQALPDNQGIAPSSLTERWLAQRTISDADFNVMAQTEQGNLCSEPKFHLIVRLHEIAGDSLADTLDSLANQSYTAWHIDVISEMMPPEVIDEIPWLGWHVITTPADTKKIVANLIATRRQDWVTELPAGAILDPLYLWRIAHEINCNLDARAFFVDDVIMAGQGTDAKLRLKPGVNIEWLRSSDLAGPICVHRDTWLSTDNASQGDGSPWFPKLLRIAEKFGWASIKHIADALITYQGAFPSDPKSCLTALIEDMQSKGSVAEIIPLSGQSWNIRYPLSATPRITVAIISEGQLDLLSRCLESIVEKTSYPDFDILITLSSVKNDPDLDAWLLEIQKNQNHKIRNIKASLPGNLAACCNAAVKASPHEFVLLIREEAVVIQEKWLEELLCTCLQPNIAAVSPCLVRPGTSMIENAGYTLGLNGLLGSIYQGEAKLGERGYLDGLRVARDVSALPSACMLVRKTSYQEAGGMDASELGDHLADADLCLKLRRNDQRLIFQPLATVVFEEARQLDIAGNIEHRTREMLTEAHATEVFSRRWPPSAAVDPFFNPNLSLAKSTPTPETEYLAQWQYLPDKSPRFLARPLPNAQGIFRITSPLGALRKRGQASECIWPMEEDGRELSVSELLRLSPDSVIVQHYLNDKHLAALQSWHAAPGRPFVVYALDDLVSNLAKSNPFFKNMPANTRARLKYALERCDRLVTSTNFLAEAYQHFCSDIRIVPNRLEQEIWLPLQSRKQTSNRPRIGWAGGTTHQGDLALLKEVIEQTRGEADWIFFGMCPTEIRPLLVEYHPFTQFADYPAGLAALNLDIAVAPLAQLPFNQGKSNLRLLEYGILGIPVVCTDIDPYHNSPACRVTNTPEAWIEALRERIYDIEGRELEGAAMRKWVQQDFLLENHLEEWLSAHLGHN